MTLFELLGKIVIENTDANNAIDDTADKAKNTESKLQASFDKFAEHAANAGKKIAKGLAIGTAAFTALMKSSLSLSGNVEQGLGGAEAVFGDFFQNIADKSKEAYWTMGLSMGNYLGTANKMGSLFVGTGASIEDAYEMTTEAMQRAADVAAIMGIDIEWAMESVAGMAKGNFTMMDNLGVAMNETTLAAYALEKGISTSVEEMTTAEKVGLAYEMFMERTTYAMGQYTKENDTYAGALNTAKAALQNFMAGHAEMEDIYPHVKNAIDIIADRVGKLAPVLAEGFSVLIDALVPYMPALLDKLLPTMVNFGAKLVNGIIQAFRNQAAEAFVEGSEELAANITKFTGIPVASLAVNTEKEASKYAAVNPPDADATAEEIQAWFDTVDPEIVKQYGIEPPDASMTKAGIEAWWKTVRPNLTIPVTLLLSMPFSPYGAGNLDLGLGDPSIDALSALYGGDLDTYNRMIMDGSYDPDGSHKTGLDFVPRDNYLARLHQGEAVLTADEAREWRNGKFGRNEEFHDETIISGNTFVIRQESDVYNLAVQIANMKRDKRRGRGARG